MDISTRDYKMKHWIIFSILALSICGCVSDQAHRLYIDKPLPSKEPSQVEILYENPSRSFTVIADLQARNASARYMQREAAKIGADAIICQQLGGTRSNYDHWADSDRNKNYYRLAATAIVYN